MIRGENEKKSSKAFDSNERWLGLKDGKLWFEGEQREKREVRKKTSNEVMCGKMSLNTFGESSVARRAKKVSIEGKLIFFQPFSLQWMKNPSDGVEQKMREKKKGGKEKLIMFTH